MTFFSDAADFDEPDDHSKEGRVYVLRLVLKDGTILHKVGMTHSGRSTDRMMEILRSFFISNRYVPQCELRRDRPFKIPLIVEKHLHKLLSPLSHTFDGSKFSGSTELFQNVDEESLLEYIDNFTYDKLLHVTEMSTEEHELIMEILHPVDGSISEDEIPF